MNAHAAPPCAAIVAMTRQRAIGVVGRAQLPWHYGADLKRFKQVTMGGAIIMGRVTWDSLARTPLPGRRNIVLSRSVVDGVECYDELQKALDACRRNAHQVWVIGGAQIYRAAMPHLTVLDVTIVPDQIDRDCALTFPEIAPHQWRCTQRNKLPGDERLSCEHYVRIAD